MQTNIPKTSKIMADMLMGPVWKSIFGMAFLFLSCLIMGKYIFDIPTQTNPLVSFMVTVLLIIEAYWAKRKLRKEQCAAL